MEKQYGGGAPGFEIDLKPGETTSALFAQYRIERLAVANGVKVFGEVMCVLKSTNLPVRLVSAPILLLSELTTLPYNDLGTQNFLSVTPELTKIYFDGGDFKVTTLDLQRSDPTYADSVKNGWAERVTFPIAIKNISNQVVAVASDDVRFYITGDDQEKNRLMRDERWKCLKITQPVLKPGESVSTETSGRDYITLKFLENEGYKPGDKIIAIVGGRIPGTNNIFECYSAPFDLPPLPKGEPPTAANNVNGTSTISAADKTSGNKENSTASSQSQSSTTPAAQSAKQPAPQAPTETEATPQRANGVWYIAGAVLLALLAIFFIKRSRKK
jgi:hypothetical protein